MSSLLHYIPVLLYISASLISSQLTCEFYSQDLPVSLFDHVAGYSSSANSMYIMGGKASYAEGGSGQRTVYKRNLSSDAEASFKPIAEIPDLQWRSDGVQTMFPVDNILYVIGVSGAAHTVNKFDTISNQWLVNGAEPPTQLDSGCIAYNESHFVMIDGWSWSPAYNQTPFVYIQFYDIARDMWTQHTVEPPFSTTGFSYILWRYQYCAFVDDKLHIFGGKIGGYGGSSSMYLDGMWRYDMLNQQFTRIGTLPRPCAYGTTAVDGVGHMYLLGCYDRDDVRDHYTNEILVFDSSAESIVPDAILSRISITETAAVILNQALWIFGGSNEDTAVVSDKIQICDISSFFGTTKEPSTEPSREPSAAPRSAMPSSSQNESTRLVLTFIIVLAALACFCGAVLLYLWSGKRSQQQAQQPKNDIVSAQVQPIALPQSAIHNQPVVQLQPQFVVHAAARQLMPVAQAHMHPSPLKAAQEKKFVYDPNKNYKKEGDRPSIITPISTPQRIVDDTKSDDGDDEMYDLNNHQTTCTSTQRTNTRQMRANDSPNINTLFM